VETAGPLEAVPEGFEVVGDFVLGFGDEFGGGRGGGGAEVGGEVGDGEVGFVADGGDDGDFRGRDGAGEEFAVEGGEVFERAAAAGDDDDIDGAFAIEVLDAGGDFDGGGCTLHGRRVEKDVQGIVAAIADVEEVADDGSGGRGDDADAMGEGGERPLALRIEEALSLETSFELFEGDLERPCTDRLHELGDELHLTALFEDGYFAANEDVQAVFWTEAKQRCLATEENGGELGVAVFECEISVPGGGGAVVGDFALEPEIGVFALDGFADIAYEFADGPDAALGRDWRGFGGFEGEAELTGLGGRGHLEKSTRRWSDTECEWSLLGRGNSKALWFRPAQIWV